MSKADIPRQGGAAEVNLARPRSAYDYDFFQRHRDSARQSAHIVVPLIMEIISPKSIVDVGCGTGTWLSVFKSHGAHDVLGIDGDHVAREWLEIEEKEFRPWDLAKRLSLPRTFDVVVSLEVAEHLAAEHAGAFVASLAALGPAIVFSAAIPFQGGEHHVNEQWPDFWARLFQEHRFLVFDLLRDAVWSNERIAWWYAQNMLLFVREDRLCDYPRLDADGAVARLEQLRRVHPLKYLEACGWLPRLYRTLETIAAHVPAAQTLVLADGRCFGPVGLAARHTLPLPPLHSDRSPTDDRTAINDLEHMRRDGARYFALASTAFWWLEHYPEFTRHVEARYPRIACNEDVIVYDLRPRQGRAGSVEP